MDVPELLYGVLSLFVIKQKKKYGDAYRPARPRDKAFCACMDSGMHIHMQPQTETEKVVAVRWFGARDYKVCTKNKRQLHCLPHARAGFGAKRRSAVCYQPLLRGVRSTSLLVCVMGIKKGDDKCQPTRKTRNSYRHQWLARRPSISWR